VAGEGKTVDGVAENTPSRVRSSAIESTTGYNGHEPWVAPGWATIEASLRGAVPNAPGRTRPARSPGGAATSPEGSRTSGRDRAAEARGRGRVSPCKHAHVYPA